MTASKRKLGLISGATGIVGSALLLAGCSSGGVETGVATTQERLNTNCANSVPCQLAVKLPASVANGQLVVTANGQLSIGDNTVISLENSASAPIANTGTGPSDIGTRVSVASVSARGPVSVRSNARVIGTAYGSSVSVQAGATVGSIKGAASAPATESLTVTFAPTTNDVYLEPSSTRSLAPGRYGALTVNRAAVLHFAPGVYYVDSIDIESGGTLELDSRAGTVVVYVRGTIIHRGALRYTGTASDALFAVFGTGDIPLEGQFGATILAPNASLTIGPANNDPSVVYQGTYFASSITVRPNVRIKRTQITSSGSAIGSVGITYAGDPNTPLPSPIPSPTGVAPLTYLSTVDGYLQQLVAAGYRGRTVQIAAPPAYQGAEPNLNPDARAEIPNPPAAPAPGSHDALVSTAVPSVQQAYPETKPGYVTPVTPDTSFCPLGKDTSFPPVTGTGGGGGTDATQGFAHAFGDPRPSPMPDFDGWFGGHVSGNYGISSAAGLHAQLDADFAAGFSAFSFPFDVILAEAHGYGQTNKPTTGDQLTASAKVTILGDDVVDWDYAASQQPLHGDLCAGNCSIPKLLPQDIELPIAGLVTLTFNAGLEAALPVSFEPTATGPVFTFSPMARAYAEIAALAGQGLRIGIEGDVDVLRVDSPLRAATKFTLDTSPSQCKATLAPTMDVKLKFSTLNGTVYVVVQVFAGVGYVDLARWQLFSWNGLSYDLANKDFSSELAQFGLSVPLPKSACTLETSGCTTAPATQLGAGDLVPGSSAVNLSVPKSYFDPSVTGCPGQYLLDIPPAKLTGKQLEIEAGWDQNVPAQDPQGNDVCAFQRAVVNVYGRATAGADWQLVDFRKLQGSTVAGSCSPTVVDHGVGEPGLPASGVAMFLTPSKWAGGLRLSVIAAESCLPVPLLVKVAEDFN